MSYAQDQYIADGSTSQFNISFPFLKRDHVEVQVNTSSVSFTWVNDSTVQLDSTPAEGDVVTILRQSVLDSRLVDFTAGSILKEQDLDKATKQLLYLIQETKDYANAVHERSISLNLKQNSTSYDTNLPFVENLENKIISFDSDNQVIFRDRGSTEKVDDGSYSYTATDIHNHFTNYSNPHDVNAHQLTDVSGTMNYTEGTVLRADGVQYKEDILNHSDLNDDEIDKHRDWSNNQTGLYINNGNIAKSAITQYDYDYLDLGLGSIADQNAGNVNISGGEITNMDRVGFIGEWNVGTASSNVTVDWSNSNNQVVTLSGNAIISFTNMTVGHKQLKIIQDNTGGRTPTLPSGKWPGGVAGSFSIDANAEDILSIYYDGSNYYYMLTKGWA
jgi:hypothetical protein